MLSGDEFQFYDFWIVDVKEQMAPKLHSASSYDVASQH